MIESKIIVLVQFQGDNADRIAMPDTVLFDHLKL